MPCIHASIYFITICASFGASEYVQCIDVHAFDHLCLNFY